MVRRRVVVIPKGFRRPFEASPEMSIKIKIERAQPAAVTSTHHQARFKRRESTAT
jgi:hypothetical protein